MLIVLCQTLKVFGAVSEMAKEVHLARTQLCDTLSSVGNSIESVA